MHATLCDLMTDLVQNSVEADAAEIRLIFREQAEWIEFEIKDNGRGMSSTIQANAVDPFYTDGRKHAHRRVGLGLPFLMQTATATGGEAVIESEEGRGTRIRFRAPAAHVDLPPVGDFSGAAVQMLTLAQGELSLRRERGSCAYTLSRNELNEILGGLEDAGSLKLLRTYLDSQEEDLRKAG